jgi:peptidoglycan/LPS O-acetylase OafA/YrhL
VTSQKIDALTSLRFFAAAAIVAYHCRGHFGLPVDFLSPFELSQGVSFFFVLSGFILAFRYPELDGARATNKFWLARFARVWPLHLATFLLYLTLLPEFFAQAAGESAQGLPIWLRALANLGLVQSWVPVSSLYFSFNSVSWSISTEAFFYLCFPFLIKKFATTWHYKLAGALVVVFCLAACANAAHLPMLSRQTISTHGLMYINPLPRVFEFILGMAVALWYQGQARKAASGTGNAVSPKASFTKNLGLEVSALGLVYLLTFYTHKIAHWLVAHAAVGDGGLVWLEHAGVPALGFAYLVAVMALGRGPLSALLRNPILVLLGEISFSMYLLHRMLLHYYWNHFAPEHGPLALSIYAAILLASSYLCWSLIENPCRKFIMGRGNFAPLALKNVIPQMVAASVLVAGSLFIWSGAPLTRLAPAVARVAPSTNIAFGDKLRLLAAESVSTDGGVNVVLRFQALRNQRVDNNINLKLLTDKGVLVRNMDFRQSNREEYLKAGESFENKLFIPISTLTYVKDMAFSLGRTIGDPPQACLIDAEQNLGGNQIQNGLVSVKPAAEIAVKVNGSGKEL